MEKTNYEKETEIIYGQDTCCGSYCSEAGCCPFGKEDKDLAKSKHEKS